MAFAWPLNLSVKADWSVNLSLSLLVTTKTMGMDWLVTFGQIIYDFYTSKQSGPFCFSSAGLLKIFTKKDIVRLASLL